MSHRIPQIAIRQMLVATLYCALASLVLASGLEQNSPFAVFGSAFGFGGIFGWLGASLYRMTRLNSLAVVLSAGIVALGLTYMTMAMIAVTMHH